MNHSLHSGLNNEVFNKYWGNNDNPQNFLLDQIIFIENLKNEMIFKLILIRYLRQNYMLCGSTEDSEWYDLEWY